MIAMIQIEDYPFDFLTSPGTLRIQELLFPGCTVPVDTKETKLGSTYQEASPSASKNTDAVSVPCLHGSVSLQLLLVV